MISFASIRLLGVVSVLVLASLSIGPAHAGDCSGTVGGLSRTYNLNKGTGFLAIRARPTSSSRMIGQTFNGNTVGIDRRRGNWLYIYDDASNTSGWVFARYVRRTCDGV
ncbi:SH3 domain-containing protein [Ahrensia sp. R2A130]|uniref:SH3 domain-containing protein n=1 Tax=Ahrensia sp. R2A130 TaxID=744979 RepID=UPI0001E09C43|nr:SH3 domain-containing protein [Ahrensia sp. R2A130]EFL89621.1 Bacterial SH3 domain superfamily protein [Ahrensia sp. R2A130]